jgi:hypothetical protein
MNYSILLVAAIPLVCVVYFAISRSLNKGVTAQRDSANSLIVLSGMLAALAILIPLGAKLLPEKRFSWPAWLLVGALLTGVVCIFGTIYSMISLQDKAKFTPKDPPYIPSWINATWFSLGLLALTSVLMKSLPAEEAKADLPNDKGQARFLVAHDLPQLGTNRQVIETAWGTPALDSASELLYRARDGVIVFCLDANGAVQSITETKETDDNALRALCK